MHTKASFLPPWKCTVKYKWLLFGWGVGMVLFGIEGKALKGENTHTFWKQSAQNNIGIAKKKKSPSLLSALLHEQEKRAHRQRVNAFYLFSAFLMTVGVMVLFG